MRAAFALLLTLSACVADVKNPTPSTGPTLVVFRPWRMSKEARDQPSAAVTAKIESIAREVFSTNNVIFEDEALREAGVSSCGDIPCTADAARKLNAQWFLVGQVWGFPPSHCFAFFSARSFESGAEVMGYTTDEINDSKISLEKASFDLQANNLKKCDEQAFYDGVRKNLRQIAEDPELQSMLRK